MYEDAIKNPDVGKSVTEVYDLENYKAQPEWQQMYNCVKHKAVCLELPLDG